MFFYQILRESLTSLRKLIHNPHAIKLDIEEHALAKRRFLDRPMIQIKQKFTLLFTNPIATAAFGFGC